MASDHCSERGLLDRLDPSHRQRCPIILTCRLLVVDWQLGWPWLEETAGTAFYRRYQPIPSIAPRGKTLYQALLVHQPPLDWVITWVACTSKVAGRLSAIHIV